MQLDLASQASVHEAAAELLATRPQIDLLVNNAGVMAPPRRTTADGFELHMATNHFGPFALTGLLIDALHDARVVTISSGMHRGGKIAFDDLQSERSYHRWQVYSESKLANLLFAFELGRGPPPRAWVSAAWLHIQGSRGRICRPPGRAWTATA